MAAIAPSARRATTPASITSLVRCGTRVSTFRHRSSRSACRSPRSPAVTVGGASVAAKPLEFTIGTPPQGVTGPLVAARVEDSPGCSASDYDGLPVAGAVVLVDRGQCQFSVKQAAAAERGAVALIVANSEGDEMGGTLGTKTDVKIPVVSVTKESGDRLRAEPGETTIKLNAGVRTERTRNVIAQTKTGSTTDVVMAGAHLDSVAEGPGINDNGSGVAAVLETALQLGSSPEVNNAVRFGFWGAEELGLLGSNNYLESLDVDGLKDIALYLNFDMVGSPNPGYFTYDGDQSAKPDPRNGVPRVPEGSAGIERTLVAYLKGAGKPPEDIDFDGRSDYDGFTQAGRARRWDLLRRRVEDVRRASRAVGRRGGSAVRSELPQGVRHAGPHRSNGDGDQRRRRGLRGRALRAGSGRAQRSTDPR